MGLEVDEKEIGIEEKGIMAKVIRIKKVIRKKMEDSGSICK